LPLPRLGAYSREIIIGKADGRTKQGRLLAQVRRGLIDQCGGEAKLTPVQRLLIERAAHLQLRCSMLDARLIDGRYTPYDNNVHAAFCNALRRTLEALNLETPIAAPAPSLHDYIAQKSTAAKGATA
jgi:hypothetical protein